MPGNRKSVLLYFTKKESSGKIYGTVVLNEIHTGYFTVTRRILYLKNLQSSTAFILTLVIYYNRRTIIISFYNMNLKVLTFNT